MCILIDGQRVKLEPQELTVFAALYNARGRTVAGGTLESDLYGHRSDGGPDDAAHIIRVYITALRRKLQPTDFRIINDPWRGWRLVRLPEVIQVAAA